jgi:putative SOS response-associated peptidase YedK
MGSRLINARSESAHHKPAFRDAFARRRCLIPADGFYEWKQPEGGTGPKRPQWIHRPDRRPFAFAGLWERWRPREGAVDAAPLVTFTILTTRASDWMRPIHDRMPVVVPQEVWDRWMDPATSVEEVRALLEDMPAPELEATEVSTLVNRPANDDPGCIEPLA